MKKAKQFLCAVLTLVTFITFCSFSANAKVNYTENFADVILSISASQAPNSILSTLQRFNVNYDENSVIEIIRNTPSVRSVGGESSILTVLNTEGEKKEFTSLAFYANTSNDNHLTNFTEELLAQTQSSWSDSNIWAGNTIVSTTVYNTFEDGVYFQPTSQNVTCYNNGNGTRPSSVTIRTTLAGELRSKPGYSLIQQNYLYTNDYQVNSPVYGQKYSKSNPLASNRVILRENGLGGMNLITKAVIGGKDYSYAIQVP